MRQPKWFLPVIVFVLSTLLLNACSFSVEVFSASPSTPPTFTPDPPTAAQTAAPTVLLPASATPTLISIRSDTISMLEIFMNIDGGEAPRSMAFSPDGTVLASAGGDTGDFAIHIWEVASGREIGALGGHSNIVQGVAFSPDGQMLATVSSDGTAQVRDWRKGEVLKILNFPGEVASVSFSPDGQSLAVGGVDAAQNQVQNAAVWIFSVGSWEPLVKCPEYWNIGAMAYSPRGDTLVGGGTSRNVQVWRTNDGTPVFTLNHAHQVSKAAISPDSSTVATATCETVMNAECIEGGVWLWDLPTGRLIRKLAGFADTVESVMFSADGSSLITAARGGMLRFYGTSDYQPLFEFTSPGGVSALALSPDGSLLATGSGNGDVNLWKIVYRP